MKSMQCDRCGGSLPFEQELGARCVRCLLELGVVENTKGLEAEDRSNAAGHLSAGTCVGRYRILRLIGEGGMGVVYEAEQEQPRRYVALKLIRPGMTGKATLRRFERETQALGRLQHPGIAQIYDAGAADTGVGAQPFFAMELIRGLTPGEYVKQHRLSVEEMLELVAKVAEAVHHAHQRGIIHRDLKPSNILVDERGQPKVLDFSVSRAIDDDGIPRTRQTEVGQLLGTVAYMSPEQVTGDPHEIDVRTDVYALGVILYELLADCLPYNVEGNLHEALTAVREAEPRPLGALARDYRGDIETIAAKALEKDKNRRYTSAAELAADIRRFLAEEPIIARPPTATYQLKKFARRNKVLVRAAAMMIIALVLGVIISTWQASRARLAEQAALVERDRARQAEATAKDERDRARQAELIADEQRNFALDAQRQAIAAEEMTGAERDRANAERDRANAERDRALSMQQRADEERSRAQSAEDQARHETTVASTQRRIAVSQQLISRGLRPEVVRADYDLASLLVVQALRFNTRIPGQSRQTVDEALQQALMWAPIHELAAGDSTAYVSVAFSSDGMLLAAGGGDQIVRVWNLRTPGQGPLLLDQRGTETGGIRALEFSDDGRLLAVGSLAANPNTTTTGTIRIWNLKSAASPPLILAGGGDIESLVFSPDGVHLISSATNRVAIDEAVVVLWDLLNPKSPRIIGRQTVNTMPSGRVAAFPDGPRIVGSQANPANILPSGRVALSPDGIRVAVATATDVKVWDLRDPMRELFSVKPPPLASSQSNPVHSVAFSPDGVHLAISSSGIHIWDLRNLQAPPAALNMPANWTMVPQFRLLTYGSSGKRITAAGGTYTLIWDLSNPTARPEVFSMAGSAVSGMAFSQNSQLLALATGAGVTLRDLSGELTSQRIPRDYKNYTLPFFVYSADLTRIFDAMDEVPTLWDLRQSPPSSMPLGNERRVNAFEGAVFCKNDTRLLQTGPRGIPGFRLTVWDVSNRIPLALGSRDFYGSPNPFACSADGTRAAVPHFVEGSESSTQIIDLERPDMPTLLTLRGAASAFAFSRDGKILAIGRTQRVELWDLANPRVLIRTVPLGGQANGVMFSPDGNRLVIVSTEGGLVWDIRNATVLLRFPYTSSLSVFTFSLDGTRFAASTGSTARVWDLQNPDQWVDLVLRPANVLALGFSSDGLRLRAGDIQGRVQEWPLGSAAADLLCTRVWRNLSTSEWKANVGEDIPYERTCPNLPPGTPAEPK